MILNNILVFIKNIQILGDKYESRRVIKKSARIRRKN